MTFLEVGNEGQGLENLLSIRKTRGLVHSCTKIKEERRRKGRRWGKRMIGRSRGRGGGKGEGAGGGAGGEERGGGGIAGGRGRDKTFRVGNNLTYSFKKSKSEHTEVQEILIHRAQIT